MLTLTATTIPSCTVQRCPTVRSDAFPSFLPKEVHEIKDPFARKLASRIQRLPPLVQSETSPVLLLHGFDSSCLEWRYTYPLLEEAGLETWAVDILGWGFSDLHFASLDSLICFGVLSFKYFNHSNVFVMNVTEKLPSRSVTIFFSFGSPTIKSRGYWLDRALVLLLQLILQLAIRKLWKLPAFQVERLVLIDASVYTEGTTNQPTLSELLAYAGAYLLKSFPLRFYVNFLSFTGISLSTSLDWTNIGRLHCRFPWWEDALVDFMMSGIYNVSAQIDKMNQRTLIIWGEEDQVISNKLGVRLHSELPSAIIRQIPDCGHLPHVEKPTSAAKMIVEFVQEAQKKEVQYSTQF